MSRTRTRFAGIAASLAIGTAGAIAVTQPASAGTVDDIKICLSDASYTGVHVYKLNDNWAGIDLNGGCTSWLNDTGNNPVRVRVYNTYAIGIEGQGYGDCHSGGNTDSNPPSGLYPKYVKYRTTSSGYCEWLI